MQTANAVSGYLKNLEERLREAATIQPAEEEDGVELMLRFLPVFRADIHRRSSGVHAQPKHLPAIRQAIEDGGELLYCARVHGGSDFEGWHHGCKPQNELQQIANAVSEGVWTLSLTVAAILEEHPHLSS